MKGKNKVRDAQICRLYAEENKTAAQISEIYNLTKRRIGQILRKNVSFLMPDKNWEKVKRIAWLKRQIGNRTSKKDPADLVEQIRKEVEGEKSLIDNSREINITLVAPSSRQKDVNRLKTVLDENNS